MSNGFYEKSGEALSQKKINWLEDTIRLVLLDLKMYTPDLQQHEFLSSVPKAARIAVSEPLTGKTVTGFVWDADDLSLPKVTGAVGAGVVLFQQTMFDKTSRLLLFVDTAPWLPFQPNGGDLQIRWSDGPNKVCRF